MRFGVSQVPGAMHRDKWDLGNRVLMELHHSTQLQIRLMFDTYFLKRAASFFPQLSHRSLGSVVRGFTGSRLTLTLVAGFNWVLSLRWPSERWRSIQSARENSPSAGPVARRLSFGDGGPPLRRITRGYYSLIRAA